MDESPTVLWELPLTHSGLGGIAADDRVVILGDRDDDDFQDIFRCLNAATGEVIWEVERLAVAALDYGNSPRTTPLISGSLVYCLGAHGHLLCIRIADGTVVWEKNFRDDFPLAEDLPWGYCGSPLLVGDKLIVAPGAPDASVVALNPETGDVLWQSPGRPPSYGSLIVGTIEGTQQIIGHDKSTLGGWDLDTGKRLWTIEPPSDGDFNVPTPVLATDGQGNSIVHIATENNGIRTYRFNESGDRPELIASSLKLRTDMSTPILAGTRLFCVKDFLYCLNANDLSEQWRIRDRALGDYAAIFATSDRLMVIGNGELLLLDSNGEKRIISRRRIFEDEHTVYSHPAMVGRRLFIRGEHKLRCLEFRDR